MFRFRRRESRKVAKLARALAQLDEQARSVPPVPGRTQRLTLNA
jgi:hypothetical protein